MLNIIHELTSIKFLLLPLIRKCTVTQYHREQLFLHVMGLFTTPVQIECCVQIIILWTDLTQDKICT